MKRTEFRKLKMYDKLVLIKKAVLEKQDEKHIASMIDECIYNTGTYVNGTSKRKEVFTKEELKEKRKEVRALNPKEPIRHIRWNKDDIQTEARKRYEKAINETYIQRTNTI